VFTTLNYYLPKGRDADACSASRPDGDSESSSVSPAPANHAFGRPETAALIGDDEHGWGGDGIFNFEGGCYAKHQAVGKEAEPEIYAASKRFGAVLENVVLDPNSREPDFDDGARPKIPVRLSA
jgi:phosphoenolpyruvate carboxykinase (ATP)